MSSASETKSDISEAKGNDARPLTQSGDGSAPPVAQTGSSHAGEKRAGEPANPDGPHKRPRPEGAAPTGQEVVAFMRSSHTSVQMIKGQQDILEEQLSLQKQLIDKLMASMEKKDAANAALEARVAELARGKQPASDDQCQELFHPSVRDHLPDRFKRETSERVQTLKDLKQRLKRVPLLDGKCRLAVPINDKPLRDALTRRKVSEAQVTKMLQDIWIHDLRVVRSAAFCLSVFPVLEPVAPEPDDSDADMGVVEDQPDRCVVDVKDPQAVAALHAQLKEALLLLWDSVMDSRFRLQERVDSMLYQAAKRPELAPGRLQNEGLTEWFDHNTRELFQLCNEREELLGSRKTPNSRSWSSNRPFRGWDRESRRGSLASQRTKQRADQSPSSPARRAADSSSKQNDRSARASPSSQSAKSRARPRDRAQSQPPRGRTGAKPRGKRRGTGNRRN